MISDEDILVISSLLHDIGKIENRIKPFLNHEKLGADFLNNNLLMADEYKKMIIDLVRYHHSESNELENFRKNDGQFLELLNILKEADNKSASHERDDKIKNNNIIKKLKKIFVEVQGENKSSINMNEYFPPYTLVKFKEKLNSNSKDIFEFKENEIDEYSKILKELELNLKNFDFYDLAINKSKINTLNSILMNTTRMIPAAFYYSEPNVSLYDHLKMTAAISQIIYREKNKEDKNILLIYGDIIGVQNYIFKYFKSSGADDKGTKRLRGRSVMIKLINDSIINYILDELNLYQFNILFDPSDKFFIISDYSEENEKKLEKIRENVEKFLFDIYRDINISLVWKKEKLDIIINEGLGKLIQDIMDDAAKRKLKLHSDVNIDSKFFIVDSEGIKLCEKCGIRPAKEEDTCEMCALEEKIGEKIVKIENIYRTNTPVSEIYVEFKYGSRSYYYNFEFDGPSDNINTLEIISINETDYTNIYKNIVSHQNLPVSTKVSWRFILQGNFIPKENNRVKTLNELACIKENRSSEERSCLYLGILKGDIDNMGKILRIGFGKNYNFTKYSGFSFYTNIFFTLIINKIASDHDIYIAYSGGDDIVAIGEIDNILQFSKDFNKNFRKWFINPNITISIGIAMLDTTYPLWKGVIIAEDILKKSKASGKNKISVFENTLSWGGLNNSEDFEKALEVTDIIYDSIKNKKLPKGFPYFLLELEKFYPKKSIKPRQKIKIPDPYLEYYLKRRINDEKYINDIRDKILNNFEYIRFSAIYSIIRLRKDDIKNPVEVKE